MPYQWESASKTMLPQSKMMEWQVVGYCLIPFSVMEAFAPTPSKRERVCKMSFKSKGCKDCRMRSCCDLAERNARLWHQGKLTKERFDELTLDLRNTCEIAGTYQNWLVKSDLPLTSKRFHTRFKERKNVLQGLARQVEHPPERETLPFLGH